MAQNSNGVRIADDAGGPLPSALLQLDADDRGLLVPRLSNDDRDAIESPADGLMIFNISSGFFNYYDSVEGEWFALQPPRTQYVDTTQALIMGGAAFHPARNAENYSSSFGQGGATYSSGLERIIAPVNLPVGSRITEITYYYRDDDAGSEMRLALFAEIMLAGSYLTIETYSTGEAATTSGWTSVNVVLDDGGYVIEEGIAYQIDVFSSDWSNDMRIKGVRIDYVLPSNN